MRVWVGFAVSAMLLAVSAALLVSSSGLATGHPHDGPGVTYRDGWYRAVGEESGGIAPGWYRTEGGGSWFFDECQVILSRDRPTGEVDVLQRSKFTDPLSVYLAPNDVLHVRGDCEWRHV